MLVQAQPWVQCVHPWVRGTPVPNSMFHRGHRGWVFDVSKKEVSGE